LNFYWFSIAEFVHPEIVQGSRIKWDWFSAVPSDPDSLAL